jgi:UDP-glucose 4-epimerase
MKILVTGGTGFIGSHAAVALQSAGHEIVIVDNLSNSDIDVVARIERVTGKVLAFINADVRDAKALEGILIAHRVDAVMHFAGLKAVGDSVKDPLGYYDNNVAGTIALLQAMRIANVKSFVFSSSATVYGEPKYLPYDELHPTSAVNPYGRTKLHIEEILMDLAASDSTWRIACLRYFNPVGAHDSGLIGESPRGIPNNLMPYLARVAAGSLPRLQVFGDDYPTRDGTGVRDYIHVMDLAEGHLAALEFIATHAGCHIYNLGSGQGISVLEMINEYQKTNTVKIDYQISPRRAGDIAEFYADPSKAKQDLAWECRRDLADMCLSSWQYQKTIEGFGSQ